MPNPDHLSRLDQGRDAWNAWRQANPDLVPQLRSAPLAGRDLRGFDLHDAYLRRAHLQGARLDGCKLREANLSGAELEGATLTGAGLVGANLRAARMHGADLTGADLKSAILVGTDLTDARLDGAQVYGIAAWEVTLDGAGQRDLLVTRPDQPRITVDDLEVAQFIYVMLNHRKLRDVFNTTTQRGVLILGRFGGGGLEVLRAVADTLRQHGLLPVIFDFERPRQRNYTETVVTLAGLCSFVIVDLSGPSVPQELQAIVGATLRMPLVPIVEGERKPAAMLADFAELDGYLGPPIRFDDIPALVAQLPARAIAPAQAWLARRRDKLAAIEG
ncbi:pentapeptide repeat-containing protein [Zoogloea sp.]|uniref:pentapeptide repeat-containing protein n=1 Tax=Zoogloea sp. TaxID=49181 RepID=UPI0035B007C1